MDLKQPRSPREPPPADHLTDQGYITEVIVFSHVPKRIFDIFLVIIPLETKFF